MKYFLTFGNERFIHSRKRIIDEAKELNIFDNFSIETEKIVEDETYKNALLHLETKSKYTIDNLKHSRGFFWYSWKPYILLKALEKLNTNDILLYCDSGMKIYNSENNKNKLNNLIHLVEDTEKCPSGIITFITTGNTNERYEYMYTINDVFKYFNVQDNLEITNTQQVQAGIILIKKNETSVNIIKQWYTVFENEPKLFIGDPRYVSGLENKNHTLFRDHRHDQSIWSVLCKLNNVTIVQHTMNPITQTHCRC